MIFPDPKYIVDGEEVTNPNTGVIYVYDQATNSWNVKAEEAIDTGEFATIVYSDAEDAKLKALIDDNTAQIEEWANSISSGSYTWNANAVAVGDVASIPSTQGNWSVVTKIAIEPTPIGVGGVSVAAMSIGDIISFTSPDDDDYATFEITDTDSANSTIDVDVVDSEGGPAYLSTVMVKHYPQIDTSNFVTNVEFNTAVTDLQDQIDNFEVIDPDHTHDHTHPDYSLTTHTHPYSPLSHNHGGDYAEMDHDHDDLKQGIEDLTDSVAELNKSKPHIFKYQASLPLTDGDFTILGEDGLSVGELSEGKSIIWNMGKPDVQYFVKAGALGETLKMNEVGDPEEWMAAKITNVAESGDWSIDAFYTQGSATGDAEYIFELLPPGTAAAPVSIGENPPADDISKDGDLWWDSGRMEMFIRYQDAWITTNALSARVEAGEQVQAELLARVAVGEEQQAILQDQISALDNDKADKTQTNQMLTSLAQDVSDLETKTYNNQEAIKDKSDKDHAHDEYLTNSGNQELTQTWKLKSNSKTFMTIADDKMNIYHVADPDNATHVANRNYVDTVKEGLQGSITTLQNANTLQNGQIQGLQNDKADNDHVHPYAHVDDVDMILRPLTWTFMGTSTAAADLGPGEFTIATSGNQNTSDGRFKIYLHPYDSSGKRIVAQVNFSHDFSNNFLVSVEHVGGGGGITGKSLNFYFHTDTANNYHRLETNWWKVAYSLSSGQEYIIQVPGLLPTFGTASASNTYTLSTEEEVDGEVPASDEQEEQVND